MPIPFILGGLAAAAAGYGIKKGLDAREDMEEANELNEDAQYLAKEAENRIDKARKNTATAIEELGRTKIEILSGNMKTFVKNFSRIKNVNFKDSIGLDELEDFTPDSVEFSNLEKASFKASDIARGGLGGAAAGSLMAAGAFSAISHVGFLGATAATGTAIAGLSGAAATNATLAWLGGGALYAGGFGMAGGMMVLGGLVAGPALAIGGAFMASKAKEALYDAEENYDKARAFNEQSLNITSELNEVAARADQIKAILLRLDNYFAISNDALLDVVCEAGTSWKNYDLEQKKIVGACAQLAKTIKIILDTSLLGENGKITKASQASLSLGEDLLDQKEQKEIIKGFTGDLDALMAGVYSKLDEEALTVLRAKKEADFRALKDEKIETQAARLKRIREFAAKALEQENAILAKRYKPLAEKREKEEQGRLESPKKMQGEYERREEIRRQEAIVRQKEAEEIRKRIMQKDAEQQARARELEDKIRQEEKKRQEELREKREKKRQEELERLERLRIEEEKKRQEELKRREEEAKKLVIKKRVRHDVLELMKPYELIEGLSLIYSKASQNSVFIGEKIGKIRSMAAMTFYISQHDKKTSPIWLMYEPSFFNTGKQGFSITYDAFYNDAGLKISIKMVEDVLFQPYEGDKQALKLKLVNGEQVELYVLEKENGFLKKVLKALFQPMDMSDEDFEALKTWYFRR